MKKVNSMYGKTWENTNIPKLKVSYIFLVKRKSMQFPKDGMSESPSYRVGKHRQFPSSTLPHRC